MHITVQPKAVRGGFVVAYRRQLFRMGQCIRQTIEFVGRDCFWARQAEYASPFKTEAEAREVAAILTPASRA